MGSGGDTENGESVGSTSADCKRMMDLKDCIQDSPNFRFAERKLDIFMIYFDCVDPPSLKHFVVKTSASCS